MRDADTEMTVVMEAYSRRPLETGGTPHGAGPQGEAPGWLRRQEAGEQRESGGTSLYCDFLLEGMGEVRRLI